MQDFSHLSIEDLVRQCSTLGELTAWEEFVRRFHRVIATVVMRHTNRFGDASKQTVDDLIQDTYLRFCADNYRLLRNFEHRHQDAFVCYVRVVARNVVRDHFKSSYSEKRRANRIDSLSEELFPAATEGSDGSAKAIERSVLLEEVERCLASCLEGAARERNRRIFWLYYRVGLSASEIALLPGTELTTKGVESIILRMTREVRERMAAPPIRSEGRMLTAAEGILPADSF